MYYIVHQTAIVEIGSSVVGREDGVEVTYMAILAGSVAATALMYELVIRRFNPVRFLFGLRRQKQKGDSA